MIEIIETLFWSGFFFVQIVFVMDFIENIAAGGDRKIKMKLLRSSKFNLVFIAMFFMTLLILGALGVWPSLIISPFWVLLIGGIHAGFLYSHYRVKKKRVVL